MLKLILGVLLLIIILFTSYYILVEKETDEIKEDFGSGQCELSSVHSMLMSSQQQPNFTPTCCNKYLGNAETYYDEYKEYLEGQPASDWFTPKPYKDFHKGHARSCFRNIQNAPNTHHSGILIPQSNDNSHCSLYTEECKLSRGQFELYTSPEDYIDENMDRLAMCHVDDGCGFTDNLIEKCENKCNENKSINESCGGSCLTNQNDIPIEDRITILPEHNCLNLSNDREACNNSEYCEFNTSMNMCRSVCYTMNEQECLAADDKCYYRTFDTGGSCYSRDCNRTDLGGYADDLRNDICIRECRVRSDADDCLGQTGTNCSDKTFCDYTSFNVPICTEASQS